MSLLDDYLDFSKVKIEKDIIDIIMLLEDTLRSMEVLMKEKNIITNFDIIDDEIYMLAEVSIFSTNTDVLVPPVILFSPFNEILINIVLLVIFDWETNVVSIEVHCV